MLRLKNENDDDVSIVTAIITVAEQDGLTTRALREFLVSLHANGIVPSRILQEYLGWGEGALAELRLLTGRPGRCTYCPHYAQIIAIVSSGWPSGANDVR